MIIFITCGPNSPPPSALTCLILAAVLIGTGLAGCGIVALIIRAIAG